MIKAVVFIEGEPYRETEHYDGEMLFERHHEGNWGLTKKECVWDLNREGMFLCPVSDKRKYKSKKAILLGYDINDKTLANEKKKMEREARKNKL